MARFCIHTKLLASLNIVVIYIFEVVRMKFKEITMHFDSKMRANT